MTEAKTFPFSVGSNIEIRDNVSTPREDLVPAWTPEQEADFEQRMAHIAAVQGGLVPVERVYAMAGLTPPTQLSFTATLSIAKRHRASCPSCRMRRVLFAIVATGNLFGGSEARCARCWGLR